ncbi:hypothetical protein CN918_29935 [Priestia megaterium]|nr:hypothetical protein CN918_29935 [Priestia megaterium]
MNTIKALPVRTYRVRFMFEGELPTFTENKENAKENVLTRLLKDLPDVEKYLGMTIIKEDFITDVDLIEKYEDNYHRFNVSFALESEALIDGESEEDATTKANNRIKAVIDKVDLKLGTSFGENATFVSQVTSCT